ncbi:hypothetical protein OAR97_02750 [Arcobacteraceae bacterium]|nr:hypothetical protein [Arcobacteraceae bacterium]
MEKIKYIIIIILLIIIGMLYKQLLDYQNISSSLLDNNTQSLGKHQKTKDTLELLQIENEELKDKIISLEESLALMKIKYNNQNFIQDNNRTKNLPMDINPLINENNETSLKQNLTPNITLDNENEITGFGLQYNQKF